MSEISRDLKTPLLLFFGLLSFALSPLLVRWGAGTSGLTLATFRTLFAVALLFPFWARANLTVPARWPFKQPGEFRDCLLAGGFLGIHFILWIYSLAYATIASASILVTIHPILILLFEKFVHQKVYPWQVGGGILLSLSGSALLATLDHQGAGAGSNPLWGDFLAVAAAIAFAGYFLFSQRLRQSLGWLDFVMKVYTFSFLTCLLATLIAGETPRLGVAGFWSALGMALGPQIIGHGSFNFAVKFYSPTLLSSLVLTEPVLALILAIPLFGELPSVGQFGAIGVIIAGSFLTFRR